MDVIESEKQEKTRLLRSFKFPFFLIVILWAVKIIEKNSSITFNHFGILPRSIEGLRGIICSPFIHADYSHLINNSIPLFILSSCLFYFYREIAFKVFALIWLTGNIWLWSIGRPSYHIGASGIIYGLVSFLFLSGILRRNKALMVVSLLVTFLYGSLVWGILPIDYKVSFEGHLMGSVAGLVLAVYYREKGPLRQEYIWEEEQEENELEPITEHQIEDESAIKTEQKIVYFYKPKE